MSDWFTTYEDAEQMVADYLNELGNIKKFCKENKICYPNALEISRRMPTVKYPGIVQKVLEIMGYTVERKICFTLKNVKISADTDVK